MNVSLFQAAAAMNANARWQEAISENLASSSIPGFKRQDLSFSAVQAGLMSPAIGAQRFALTRASTATSFVPGEMKFTGAKTDAAIEGSGFFEVQLANGSRAYTRDGEFAINTQGQLVTKQGYLVLGDSGPLQFDQNNAAPISISSTGEVSQGADSKGKLKVMDFAQPQLLTAISGGYFVANDPNAKANEIVQPSIRQGFLEGANTSPVAEMANLISVMRTFEANQRIIQLQDERMGRAISELGSTN